MPDKKSRHAIWPRTTLAVNEWHLTTTRIVPPGPYRTPYGFEATGTGTVPGGTVSLSGTIKGSTAWVSWSARDAGGLPLSGEGTLGQ